MWKHTPTTQHKGNLDADLLQNSEQFLFSRKQFVIFYYFSFNRGLMKDVLSIISQIICLCHYVFEKLPKLSFDGNTYSP